MSALTFKDEAVHPWGPENNWQESAVISWRDPVLNLGGNHRVAVWPNRDNANLWCGVYHGRSRIYRLNLEEQPLLPLEQGLYGLGCGPQRIFHDGEHLRLTLDSPQCQANLIVEDFPSSLEKIDSEAEGQLSAQTYRNHFNYHNRLHGEVVLNGEHFVVKNALGWRDHSWGPRNYNEKLCHRSFHGNFGEKLNFHLLTVLSRTGQLDRRGYLVRDGVALKVDTFTTRMEMLEDGVTPVRATCDIFLPNDERLTFTCDVQKGVMAQVQVMRGFFGVGDCYYRGERGFCNIEIQNNPRFGSDELTLAIGNTLDNGYHEISLEPWKYEPLADSHRKARQD